jgi:calcineurin-like phosphoesterase family protein
MDSVLKTNWNRTVRENDLVIVVGDMVWTQGSSENIKNYLKELNGRIILVVGNHCKKSYSFYMANGIDFVCERFVWEFNGKRILFIHDPARVSVDERLKYHYVIHGHQHNSTPFVREVFGIPYINVSVENINYTPINLTTVLSRLTQGFYSKRM